MADIEQIRRLQEAGARAVPAEHVTMSDGWWLRHTVGGTWWVGTVLAHRDAEAGELERRVAEAERYYAGHDAIPRFQISPSVTPKDLDELLEQRGYGRHNPVSFMTAPVTPKRDYTPPKGLRMEVADKPTASWLDAFTAATGRDERDLLDRVTGPSGYAGVTSDGAVIAVGRAIADGDWVGVFGMVTLPGARGRGAARAVLTGLADWAAGRRLRNLYLQVEPDNAPAVRLYRRAGFTDAFTYHYRSLNPENA